MINICICVLFSILCILRCEQNENKLTHVIFFHGVQTDVVQYISEIKKVQLIANTLFSTQ